MSPRGKREAGTASPEEPGAEEPGAKLDSRVAELEARAADLEKRLAEAEAGRAAAEAKARENWDLFLRARADLDNYRRRVERDLESMVRRGKRDFIARLLDVADALERAAAWEAAAKAGAEAGSPAAGAPAPAAGAAAGGAAAGGVALIARQLARVLADEDVKPIDSVGRPFDPALHEAVEVTASDSVTVPTVTEELQKGYTYGEEVIRPARVRVAQPPS